MVCGRLSFPLFHKIGLFNFHQIKASYRRTVMPVNTYHRFKKKEKPVFQPQNFKYFLVLDFEATCDEAFFPDMVTHIICAVNLENLEAIWNK